jgi:DNA-binding CsgD family transcriptional regulator
VPGLATLYRIRAAIMESLIAVARGASLRGRVDECGLLDGLLADVHRGQSRSLVLRGEAGIGKTALLQYLMDSASDLTVLRAVGVESEMELPYASLQQLCASLLDRLERLPAPQRDALGVVFGLTAGVVPDRFLVGLGVLSLLSEVADECPMLCVIDDAQWLDHASALTLAFVARRLLAEPVGIVFAAREPGDELQHIPQLEVQGLRDGDARGLLGTAVRYTLDERIRDRIIAETRGNPLALLELPRGLTPTQLAGGLGMVEAQGLTGRIEQSFVRRLDALSNDARRLLLLAAADPVGDPLLLLRSAEKLEIVVEKVDTETDGLLWLGDRVTFRHPLVRSAVYRAASVHARRAVHLALAEATDREVDPDRRAWHLAAAASGPSEEVALELERSAGRAQARGGLAAAAAFLQRALELTRDPAKRVDRALAAAEAQIRTGALDQAERSAAIVGAETDFLDDFQHARLDLVRARLAFVSNRGADAPPLLLRAAKRLEPLDIGLARDTYLDALSAAMFAGRLATPEGQSQAVARAARAAPPPLRSPRPPDLLLEGLASLFSEGYAAGAPILQRALAAFGSDMSAAEELRWSWLACVSALHLWDDENWDTLSERHVQLARAIGALSELPLALSSRIYLHLFSGDLSRAASLIEELRAATEATGTHLAPHGPVGLAAMRGSEGEAKALITGSITDITGRGEGIGISVTEWATAVLYNGLGQYNEAQGPAHEAARHVHDLGSSNWGMVELIEAAVRSGQPERGVPALARLTADANVAGTDWALGIAARSRALLCDGQEAEPLYREAIERLGQTRLRPELGRAHLLYGEWLRRERRRLHARAQLLTAYEMLTEIGMDAFAERARRELLATGETARKRTLETSDDLSPQEAQIARLASDGLTNPEIGARLFISPRTVEWHLRNAFGKLGISRRRELPRVLSP